MSTQRMWMVRGEGGRLYDTFREQSLAAIGWGRLAPEAKAGMQKSELSTLYKDRYPEEKQAAAIAGFSQVWRFLNEIAIDDLVTTYSPANRTYLVGVVRGPAECRAKRADDQLAFVRTVEWRPVEIERDRLATAAKNSLGSILTIFVVPPFAASELLSAAEKQARSEPVPRPGITGSGNGETQSSLPTIDDAETLVVDPLASMEGIALERIKDRVVALDWDEMQSLVAGILRAMGYKTQISPAGPDRGKDIIASPDGFGFENPRIVVEVKHRSGAIGSQAIRSFLGGRHKDDRGLYVSTGGFSKDAYYEADRASVPLMLWTMDNLVRALVEHYESTDTETKRLVPLKRTYLPA